MRLITEPRELIARFVSREAGDAIDLENYVGVAMVNSDDELMAGAVFNGYNHPEILMHIAADHMTPGFIAAIMFYPFVQLNCKKVVGVIRKDNFASMRFAQHLGATCEGAKDDYVIYGLLRRDAEKWLTRSNLQKLEKVAA